MEACPMDIEKTIRALAGRGFAVRHFATAGEAVDYLDGAIDTTTSASGSDAAFSATSRRQSFGRIT